jgi:hypothetical protein
LGKFKDYKKEIMTNPSPRILLVGAGAVGQVYGRHLNLGGASVSFYVREKYKTELELGMPVYPLNHQKITQEPQQFRDFKLLTTIEEVAACEFDQIWLCVPATALRDDWVEPMLKASGDAVIVSLIPGFEERAILLKHLPESRLVCGMITLISYQAPLPNEACHSPGMAYWFPPATPAYFSGPPAIVNLIVKLLKTGGQPAAKHRDVSAMGSSGTAILMPLLLGLERESWSFKQFTNTQALKDSLRAIQETLKIAAEQSSQKTPIWRHALVPSLFKTILWLGERVLPLPLETYLKYHFTKVGAQTRLFIDAYIALGQDRDLPTGNLVKLRESAPTVAPTH